MNQPCLYHRANEVQRYDAEQIIREYSNLLQWRLDGGDTLLDVGTGTGDVLMDFIYTIMPENFERVVGSDISLKMIDYAKNEYRSQEKCDFRLLDISTEDDIPNDMKEQFDHVTSFYCLHWIQNQRQSLKNIYKLLRSEGGDCLLVFLASNAVFDVYKLLSKSCKWSSYLKDVDTFICPFQYCKDPKFEYMSMLREAGFSDIQVDIKNKVYVYKSFQIFKDNMKAINPFIKRMPPALHDSFMNDLISTLITLNSQQNHQCQSIEYEMNMPYRLLVAYARKAPLEY